jgi:hypothetical protein
VFIDKACEVVSILNLLGNQGDVRFLPVSVFAFASHRLRHIAFPRVVVFPLVAFPPRVVAFPPRVVAFPPRVVAFPRVHNPLVPAGCTDTAQPIIPTRRNISCE